MSTERNFDWLARQEEEKVRKAAEREAHLEADIARLRVEAKERHESEAERLLSDERRIKSRLHVSETALTHTAKPKKRHSRNRPMPVETLIP